MANYQFIGGRIGGPDKSGTYPYSSKGVLDATTHLTVSSAEVNGYPQSASYDGTSVSPVYIMLTIIIPDSYVSANTGHIIEATVIYSIDSTDSPIQYLATFTLGSTSTLPNSPNPCKC
jgi:hypothetical protein